MLGCFRRVVVSIADNGKDRIYLLTNRSDHVKISEIDEAGSHEI